MNFIEDLKTKVFCRVGVSKIHGVGVIAIRDIPKGINPMEGKPSEFIEIPYDEIKNIPGLPLEVHKLVIDMCPANDGFFSVPSHSLNECGVAWYLNHSTTPNMEERDGDFYSLVDIPVGTELTVDYGTYGALNL